MLRRMSRESFIQITILAIGIVMMAVGLYRGEALEILRKAIFVCMECIGIG